ncbi:hypothetical protein CPAR01_12201 [Colletotrichum paranaense]|uniref:Uncharacterized protein n=1 Tax=Colletotrichum paranaense TaxID=1914294 RepID=A0ABQ9S9B2_9PEZI|nr:uncharacterized protein CPAR01_12201 [Colletotrichum paranaense]KAK1529889.1 hypothetical protein CPAR01_12201 [Colletotrichum paranaense]
MSPSPPSPGFHFQPSRRPAQPALREPKALGPRVSHPSAPFLHSSKVTANISLSYSLGIRTRHTESTSHANARPSASWEPATTAAQGALASLAPSSLSPALSVTVAATTNCPLLRHSTAQHRTAPHGITSGPPACFASLHCNRNRERDGAAKPESRFTANATAAHAPPTATQRPCAPWLPFSLLSRDANSRPDLCLPLQSTPIDDTTSDQLIPIENTILFL